MQKKIEGKIWHHKKAEDSFANYQLQLALWMPKQVAPQHHPLLQEYRWLPACTPHHQHKLHTSSLSLL